MDPSSLFVTVAAVHKKRSSSHRACTSFSSLHFFSAHRGSFFLTSSALPLRSIYTGRTHTSAPGIFNRKCAYVSSRDLKNFGWERLQNREAPRPPGAPGAWHSCFKVKRTSGKWKITSRDARTLGILFTSSSYVALSFPSSSWALFSLLHAHLVRLPGAASRGPVGNARRAAFNSRI